MVFPYIGNVKYPHRRTDQQHHFKIQLKDLKRGKDCVPFHRTTTYHCCHSKHAFTGSREKFSLLRYDSWAALPWKYELGKNRIRMFLKTPFVLSGLSLLNLELSSLAVFAGVQDVVHLLFHVSIKWGAALLVHHFVVRQRLIESQPLADFSSNYSVYPRSLPTSSPGCFPWLLRWGAPPP